MYHLEADLVDPGDLSEVDGQWVPGGSTREQFHFQPASLHGSTTRMRCMRYV